MEERYLNVSRHAQGRRVAPAQSRGGGRSEPLRRRDDDWDDDWDDRPRKAARKGRSGVVGVLKGFYIFLVVISAIVVAGYIGLSLTMKAPEQKQFTPPSQNETQVPVNSGTTGADSAGTQEPDGPLPLKRRDGVYTVLLAATDVEGYRTDTMMVACYDTVKQTVGVVSVPRDTLIARPNEHVHLAYGKGGVEQRVKDISDLLGIPIDGYVKVNIKGFITLVDYLGGIDFYVPCDMNYDDDTPGQELHIHYKKGTQHLSGQQAIEVARFRKNNPDKNGKSTGYSDTGRTETQQKLLIALAKKVLSWNSLTKINGFVEIFNKNVSTDLTLDNMLYFAGQAVGLDLSAAVETATLEGNGFGQYRNNVKTYKYCYELDPEKTVETVNRLINPYDRDLTLEDMNIAKADSYHS